MSHYLGPGSSEKQSEGDRTPEKSLVMYVQQGSRKYTIRGGWGNHEHTSQGTPNMRNGIIVI